MAATTKKYPVAPELEAERRKSSFQTIELTNILDEGALLTEQRHEIEQLFIDDPNINNDQEFNSLSSDEYYSTAIERSTYLAKKLDTIELPGQIPGNLGFLRAPHISSIIHPCEHPMIVHSFMFTPTIVNQGTEEQQAKWLPLAQNENIIGTYCQTELGHGTNMRGLETTATYDPKTQEFVLNSPTLTSTKFWPGGMGRTSNAAIVVAQLYTKGECHGLHLFLVQFRSLKDHTPLPGISVGEVGPKMGLNANDNGYMRFDNFRIPRENMLMKSAKVLPDGTYIKPDTPRTGYGILIMARVAIVMDASLRLAQAATIAVRYSAVRRQGEGKPGEAETKIIDYQTQQYKLFPLVAASYAGLFTFKLLKLMYMELIASPTPERVAEIHALSSGLKSTCTQVSLAGMEQCRLACGGLGYMQASRLPYLYSYVNASCTYDGEDTVMLLQTARFLMKSYRAIKTGNPVSSTVEYLRHHGGGSTPHSKGRGVDDLPSLFQRTSANLLWEVAERIEAQIARGQNQDDAWSENLVDLSKCAKLHSLTFIITASRKVLYEINMSSSLQTVMDHLFELLALHWIRENAGDFLQYGSVTTSKLDSFNARLFAVIAELRPDIVALVDAFDFRDEALHSVIGCYDGRVYERVFDYVKKLPSNKSQVHPVFRKFLQPMMQAKL